MQQCQSDTESRAGFKTPGSIRRTAKPAADATANMRPRSGRANANCGPAARSTSPAEHPTLRHVQTNAMKTCFAPLALLAWTTLATAQATKPFPSHWGEPPKTQTRDLRDLPGGYGRGSSTLARWIEDNLKQDAARGPGPGATGPAAALFECDFSKLPPGRLPDTFMVLNGEFAVAEVDGNRCLELPGAPLDTFSVLFGPPQATNVAVSARVFGAAKGRRSPTFAIGLGGVSGYKLRISPGKEALELVKDEELRASVPFQWKSGAWTRLKLQVRRSPDGALTVEGKAWPDGAPEPAAWLIARDEPATPVSGRASVIGSPFSGTPIRFDDLLLTKAE